MSTTISSKRYAQAVFSIAREQNALDEWKTDLKKISGLMQNTDFSSAIDNPKLPFEFKAKIAREMLGTIKPMALNLVYLLIARNKFKNAAQIAEEFSHLVNEHQGIRHAKVTTAVPIDNAEKEALIQRLEIMIGSKIEAEFKLSPSILGGIIARVNGQLIDGSVLNRLEMLRKSMVGMSN